MGEMLARKMAKTYEIPSSAWKNQPQNGSTWTAPYTKDWGIRSVSAPIAINPDGTYSTRYIKFFADANWSQHVGILEMEVYEWLASPPSPARPTRWGRSGLAMVDSILAAAADGRLR